MFFIVFILVNMLLMGTLFAVGVYQFMQIEAKRKCRKLLAEASLDEQEFSTLIQADRYEEALLRLMQRTDVDRYTAESALAQIQKRG